MEVQEYLEKHNKRQARETTSKFKLFFRKLKNFFFPKPARFTRFLWWCSGADSVLLKLSPMKDRVKYAGIGGIVLCTGVLAAFSGGFAFYTIFSPKGEAVHDSAVHLDVILPTLIFGFVWGLIILNLDRFIVSSTGKGDGTDKITWKEFGQAIPRIIIALILGVAISSPLEVRILKSEIDANLQKVQEDYKIELDLQTDSVINMQIVRLDDKIEVVEVKIKDYDDYVEKRRLELKEQYRLLELEAEGKSGSGAAGRGPAWRDKKENLDYQQVENEKYIEEKADEIANLKGDRDKLHDQIDVLDASRAEKKEKNQSVAHQLDGLLKRIQISHEIGGVVPWVILAVLLCIEMGPIFFKMMLTKGVYDYLAENMDRKLKAYSGIVHKQEIFQDKDGTIHRDYYEFLEEDQELIEKKMKLERQSDLSGKIIKAWHSSKSQEISQNPDKFYDSNS
tara:strand:+ start:2313 stop:3662 length:1350 start_codon:yes stop_codon:yes gene_type:complete